MHIYIYKIHIYIYIYIYIYIHTQYIINTLIYFTHTHTRDNKSEEK